MKNYLYITLLALGFSFTSCESYLDVGTPKDEMPAQLAFSDDKTATASVVGIYSRMNQFNYQFANVLSLILPAMEADELVYAVSSAPFDEFRNNAVLSSNQYANTLWSQPYSYIAQANLCIEGLEAAQNLTPSVKDQLLGEAKFIRAFNYFYLVNNYGDVPLILGTNVAENNVIGRIPESEVYDAIVSDLQDAKALLGDGYPTGAEANSSDGERVRPNKGAASALLARAYLYTGAWALAESEAGEVIGNSLYDLTPTASLGQAFQRSSEEAIWQLQAVNIAGGRNTWEGFLLIPGSPTSQPLFRMVPGALYDAFEPGDARDTHWVGKMTTATGVTHKYPFKYKARFNVTPIQEYTMVLRLAEQYLIRAEARLEQEKFSLAEADLNVIRNRAALNSLSLGNNAGALRTALEQERQVELFAEWGHRWYDLRRWPSLNGAADKTRADDVLGTTKPSWTSSSLYIPIPDAATLSNPNLR